MKTDFVNGRDLKVGSVFIPAGETASFYKVTDINISKPGKHGSAKSMITAKNIVNGRTYTNTYLDSSDKVCLILDFGYIYKVIYDKKDTELLINLETGDCLYYQSFVKDDQQRIEDEFAKFVDNGEGLVNSEGSPLVVKYSELVDSNNNVTLMFWELLYIKPEDLPRYGINDYVALE